MPEFRVPAVELRQKENQLFLFFLPANQLERLVRSNPRVAENPEGIQRLLSQKRLREIAEYISRPETCFPNNIIVSFTKDVRFERASTGMGELVFPAEEGHFGDIIDGQHRLYGIVHANSREKSLPMPVTGLMLTDTRSAARIFADINHLQKNISNLLIVTLQRELGDLVDAKDSAAAMVEQLNQHEDSPLRGKIQMYQDQKEAWLRFDQAVNSIAPLFERGQRLAFLPPDVQLSRLINYLNAIAETFPEAWGNNRDYRLTAAAGFEVIIGLFERAHQRARAIRTSNSPSKEEFMQAIEPIKHVADWRAETFKEHGYTGSAGRRVLLKELLDELPPED